MNHTVSLRKHSSVHGPFSLDVFFVDFYLSQNYRVTTVVQCFYYFVVSVCTIFKKYQSYISGRAYLTNLNTVHYCIEVLKLFVMVKFILLNRLYCFLYCDRYSIALGITCFIVSPINNLTYKYIYIHTAARIVLCIVIREMANVVSQEVRTLANVCLMTVWRCKNHSLV